MNMSKEGPGPIHCSQRRSVRVKKKDLFLGSNHLDQYEINYMWFYVIWAQDWLFRTKAYDPFLIVHFGLLLARLTRQVLAQSQWWILQIFLKHTWISLHFKIIRHLVRVLDSRSCSSVSVCHVEPHNYQLLCLVMHHFHSRISYLFYPSCFRVILCTQDITCQFNNKSNKSFGEKTQAIKPQKRIMNWATQTWP